MSAVVESDEKGRILLPIELRRKFKAKRFKITTDGRNIELQPIAGIEGLRGKYRNAIKSEWEELEEKAEEFVGTNRR